MLCHIFQHLQAEGTVNVTFVLRQVPPLSYEHTHTGTHTVSVAIKRALPVWVLHLVSVFSTDCDGSGVSLLAVLMWRDDTCGSWIERHKGFQIGNMELWWWAEGLFLLFILPGGISGTHHPQQRTVKLCWFGLRGEKKHTCQHGRMAVSHWTVNLSIMLYFAWIVKYYSHCI